MKANSPVTEVLFEQKRCNEKSAQHEEHIHSDKPARKTCPRVKSEHAQNCQSTDPVELGAIPSFVVHHVTDDANHALRRGRPCASREGRSRPD